MHVRHSSLVEISPLNIVLDEALGSIRILSPFSAGYLALEQRNELVFLILNRLLSHCCQLITAEHNNR